MKQSQLVSIEDLIAQGKRIDEKYIKQLSQKFKSKIPWPTLIDKTLPSGMINTLITLTITKYEIPLIDLFHGKLLSWPDQHYQPPILFSFQGKNGRIYEPAIHDPYKSVICCIIPKSALSGNLELFVPLGITFGSAKELEKIAKNIGLPSFNDIPKHFETDICPPWPWPFPIDENFKWKWLLIKDLHIINDFHVVDFGPIVIGCDNCTVDCPNDAISRDISGICSVDYEICQGQRFKINRGEFELAPDSRTVYKRYEDTPCFECFCGNELYSTRCTRGILRKALHHNGNCCGSCSSYAQVYGITLNQLCSHNAISGGGYPAPFSVDKEICIGCATCYNGINCANNVDAGEAICTHYAVPNENGNYTIRMTAYADHS